jgi:hypothetical protein
LGLEKTSIGLQKILSPENPYMPAFADRTEQGFLFFQEFPKAFSCEQVVGHANLKGSHTLQVWPEEKDYEPGAVP